MGRKPRLGFHFAASSLVVNFFNITVLSTTEIKYIKHLRLVYRHCHFTMSQALYVTKCGSIGTKFEMF